MGHTQRLLFRDMLRDACAAALKDAEGFRHIVLSIERLAPRVDADRLHTKRSKALSVAAKCPR